MASKKAMLKKKSAFSAGSLVTETKNSPAQADLKAKEEALKAQADSLKQKEESLLQKEEELRASGTEMIDPENSDFITILPELKLFLPILSAAEYENLEQQIAFIDKECRDPLLVWKKSEEEQILLDGHNRLSICRKHKIPFAVRALDFDSLREVKVYMLRLQQGKRNLDKDHLSYIRGVEYNMVKSEHGGLRVAQSSNPQFEDLPLVEGGKTAEKLAEKYKVSRATIERDGIFAKGINKLPQEVFDRYWARKVKIKKQVVEQVGRLEDEQAIVNLLKGQIELIGHRHAQEDVDWLIEHYSKESVRVQKKPADLEDFFASHQKKVKGQLKKADAKQKEQMVAHYSAILDMIKNS